MNEHLRARPLARVESAAARLSVPALVEVNLPGEPSKSGVAPERARRVPRALPGRPRPDDDAARRGRSRGLAAVLRAPARARRGARARASSRWARARTTASPRRRARLSSVSGSVALSAAVIIPRPWASPTSGTARSSTSASPRRTRVGRGRLRTDEELERRYRASARTSAGCSRARAARVRRLDRSRGGRRSTAP